MVPLRRDVVPLSVALRLAGLLPLFKNIHVKDQYQALTNCGPALFFSSATHGRRTKLPLLLGSGSVVTPPLCLCPDKTRPCPDKSVRSVRGQEVVWEASPGLGRTVGSTWTKRKLFPE